MVLIKPHVADIELLDFSAAAEVARRGEREALHAIATHPVTRYMCPPDLVKDVDRQLREPREYVHLEVDASACINCGICAATCTTQGYAAVPIGSVVRKLFHYECTRDAACERNCPTGAIRLGNM
jgi:NAD-dependent dihydropyrimidine dehydrogenase PreA subunit